MNVILIELLINILKYLPWLIQGMCSQDQSPMFFQANANMYFTQRFQVEGVGHMLLDMIQEEDR
jgi:hypothetical protein